MGSGVHVFHGIDSGRGNGDDRADAPVISMGRTMSGEALQLFCHKRVRYGDTEIEPDSYSQSGSIQEFILWAAQTQWVPKKLEHGYVRSRIPLQYMIRPSKALTLVFV